MNTWRMHSATAWTRVEQRLAGELEDPARHNLRIELAGALIYGVFHTALLFIPVLMRRLGASAEELALYTGQGYIAMILVGPLLYWLRPRHAKPFIVVCLLLSRSFFVWIAFTSDATWILPITFGYLLLEHLQGPAYSRMVQTLYPASTRGRIISAIKVGMALSVLAFSPFAGQLLDRAGPVALFPLAAGAGMLAALVLTRWKAGDQPATLGTPRSLAYAWRIPMQDRRFGAYLLGVVVYGLGGLIGYPLYPFVQVDRLHLSYTDIGLLALVRSVFWVLGFLVWGRLIDRLGGPRCLAYSALINALTPLAYLLASDGWMLAVAFAAAGLANACVDVGFLSTSIALAPPERVPEYAATQSMVIGVRGLVGSFLGVGLVRLGFSLEVVFAVGVALKLLAAGVFAGVGVRRTLSAPAGDS